MLFGQNPFEKARGLVDLITIINKPNMVDYNKIPISFQCRHLLSSLMQKNPKLRMTWNEFFNHPWLNITIVHGLSHSNTSQIENKSSLNYDDMQLHLSSSHPNKKIRLHSDIYQNLDDSDSIAKNNSFKIDDLFEYETGYQFNISIDEDEIRNDKTKNYCSEEGHSGQTQSDKIRINIKKKRTKTAVTFPSSMTEYSPLSRSPLGYSPLSYSILTRNPTYHEYYDWTDLLTDSPVDVSTPVEIQHPIVKVHLQEITIINDYIPTTSISAPSTRPIRILSNTPNDDAESQTRFGYSIMGYMTTSVDLIRNSIKYFNSI